MAASSGSILGLGLMGDRSEQRPPSESSETVVRTLRLALSLLVAFAAGAGVMRMVDDARATEIRECLGSVDDYTLDPRAAIRSCLDGDENSAGK